MRRHTAGMAGPGEKFTAAVITVGADADAAGPALRRLLAKEWASLSPDGVMLAVAGDTPAALRRLLRRLVDREKRDVVLTVGLSGHRRGDFVPDVTRELLHRTLPGIEERMYLAGRPRPEDLLFRGAAGIRSGSLVINLPTRLPRASLVVRQLAPVVSHALEKIGGSDRECAV